MTNYFASDKSFTDDFFHQRNFMLTFFLPIRYSLLIEITDFIDYCQQSRTNRYLINSWRLQYVNEFDFTLRCLVNGGVKINGGSETFVKFNERGGQNKREVGRNFKKSVNIGNKWKKRHKCLILMLNLKVSKKTRSEGSKNNIIIKRVSKISIN